MFQLQVMIQPSAKSNSWQCSKTTKMHFIHWSILAYWCASHPILHFYPLSSGIWASHLWKHNCSLYHLILLHAAVSLYVWILLLCAVMTHLYSKAVAWYSDHIQQRGFPAALCFLVTIIGYVFLLVGEHLALRYCGAIFVASGVYSAIPVVCVLYMYMDIELTDRKRCYPGTTIITLDTRSEVYLWD